MTDKIFLPGQSRRGQVVLAVCALAALLMLAACNQTADQAKQAKEATQSGLAKFKKGNFKEATADLKKAATADPTNAETQRLLGQSYEATGKLRDAARSYRASLKINPNQPEALYNLAIISKSQGKTPAAIEALEKALSYNKNFVAARLMLAELYLAGNKKAKAKAEYQKVLDLKPFGIDLKDVQRKLEAIQ